MSDIQNIKNYVNSDAFADTSNPANFSSKAIHQDGKMLRALEHSGSQDSATRKAEEALMGRIDAAQARFEGGSSGIFSGSSDSDLADNLARNLGSNYGGGQSYGSGSGSPTAADYGEAAALAKRYEAMQNGGGNGGGGYGGNGYGAGGLGGSGGGPSASDYAEASALARRYEANHGGGGNGIGQYSQAAAQQRFNDALAAREGYSSSGGDAGLGHDHGGVGRTQADRTAWRNDDGDNFDYTVNSDNTHSGDDTSQDNLGVNGDKRNAVSRPGYSLTGKSDGKNTQEYSGMINGQKVEVKANGDGKLTAFVDGKEVKPGETKGPIRFEAGGPGGDGIVHITGRDDKTGQTISSDISKNINHDKSKEAGVGAGIALATLGLSGGAHPNYWKHEGLTLTAHTDTSSDSGSAS